MKTNLQNFWFKYLKEQIKAISFIAIMYEGANAFIKIRIKNESGGVDTVLFKCSTAPQHLKADDYEYVLNQLKTKAYVEETV